MVRIQIQSTAVIGMLLALVGASAVTTNNGAHAAPAGRWTAPLDFAPAKVDTSFSSATYDCGNQSPIRVVGEDSTITLNGSCGEVDVSGIDNIVNLQTVAIINAPGTGNHITWVRAPGGGVPHVSNSGASNTIVGPGGVQIQSDHLREVTSSTFAESGLTAKIDD